MSLVNNLSSILSSCLHCFSLLWCYILFLTHPFLFCLCLLGRFLYVMSSFFDCFFGRCMVSSVAPSLLFIFRWFQLIFTLTIKLLLIWIGLALAQISLKNIIVTFSSRRMNFEEVFRWSSLKILPFCHCCANDARINSTFHQVMLDLSDDTATIYIFFCPWRWKYLANFSKVSKSW